jgi:SAM-dependent methyltransferase
VPISLSQVRRYLQGFGLKFGLSSQNIDKRLERLMGRQRFADYIATLEHCRSTGQPLSVVYPLFDSLEEADLLISHQSELAVSIATWLVGQVERVATPGSTLVDLGCWTGHLTRLLAVLFPDCHVVGIDRVPRVIGWASAASSDIPNIRFLEWDYSVVHHKPELRGDVLVSSLGIDFHPGTQLHSLDVCSLDHSQAFEGALRECEPYLARWRAIAANRGHLFAVLRLSDVEPMLALSQAAHSTGWALHLSDCTKISESPESRIPALTLSATAAPEPLNASDVLSWYAWTGSEPAEYISVQAIALYRSLGERVVVRTTTRRFDDGHTMLVEAGRAGAIGYLFARATTGYTKLRLCDLVDVENLTPSFEIEHLG